MLDLGNVMLMVGWETIGMGNNDEVTGLIIGDDICFFMMRKQTLGRDFAFLITL